MNLFNKLFGNKKQSLQDLRDRNAVFLDVRTQKEWDAGHIDGAKHIALQEISAKISEIKNWNAPVITYCRSGMRSAQAAAILNTHGIETLNGGGWKKLQKKL